jgi:ankyrin repeat protein
MTETVATTPIPMDLYTAVINNSITDVIRCLDTGTVDIDMTSGQHGSTPLIEAVSLYPRTNDIACLLLEKDANPFQMNKQHDTALGIAASWGNVELVKIMTSVCGEVPTMSTNKNGYSAYDQAELMQHVCRNQPIKNAAFTEIMCKLEQYKRGSIVQV